MVNRIENAIQQTLRYGTHECREWRSAIFNRHHPIANELAGGFIRQTKLYPADPNAAGNHWLRETVERLRFGHRKFSALLDDDEIAQLADQNSKMIDRLYCQLSRRCDFDEMVSRIRFRVELEDVPWPADIRSNDSNFTVRSKKAVAIAQVRDPKWWRQVLRKLLARKVESVLRESGTVSKAKSPYLSSWAYARWLASNRRNRNTLENLLAISDEGDELPLCNCVDSSVSNPTNRRNELMTRMRGWESISDTLDLQGIMLTLTTPSQFHAYQYFGEINSKFNCSTPIDAISYLNTTWAKIRSAWQRAGIKTFGFRICEPHHDGTPHFHFLLFFSPMEWKSAWETFKKYAMELDGDEPGAAEHRCDFQLIDKNKGSATGYVAKYVAKNIDGYGFQENELDQESDLQPESGASRVRAWASIWGIRQFQQIGSVSVSVYRELRRLAGPLADHPEKVELARIAADRGDWAAFVEAMGGAFIRRDEQLLRPLTDLADTPGRYGNEIRRILGLVMRNSANQIALYIRTRIKIWKIVPISVLQDQCDRNSTHYSNTAPPPQGAAGKAANQACGGPSQKVRSTI